jgi:hypothetical protein
MDADIRRISENVLLRMARGWIDGDPNTLGVRPLTRSHRSYLVQYLSQGYRVRWIVDATAPGVLLTPAGERHDEGDRPDVLISSILRVLKSREPNMYRREELTRLRESALAEGFDFPTLYTLAVRQLGALVEDMAELMGDLVAGPDQDAEPVARQAA